MNQITLDLTQESLEAIKVTMLDSAKEAFDQVAKQATFPKYMKVGQAAKFLNMSTSTFNTKVKPFVTATELNGLIRYDKTDLIEFMDHYKI
jgi:hypothetical protein